MDKVRGIACLAVVLMMAGTALAQDSVFQAAAAANGVGNQSPQPRGALSNAGLDRLLDINANHYSVLRKSNDSEESTDDMVLRASTPLGTVDDAPIREGRGIYIVGGIGGALALGLGLCCASLMPRRQRTINTFAAGFVRVK